ncbi:anthranilate synthase component II, partial [Sediminivirga luteola]
MPSSSVSAIHWPGPAPVPRILLADNHDSYTYNLFQLISVVSGHPPMVLRNDAPEWGTLRTEDFDAAVIGPGPGTPARAADIGGCTALLAAHDLPVLGVCLGHQALGAAAGGRLGPAGAPRHGHLSDLRIEPGADLFAGIGSMRVVRYHSLSIGGPLPPALELQAVAEDGEVMAFRHRARPHWGVQFHPESILTEHGDVLIRNFLTLAAAHPRERVASVALPHRGPATSATPTTPAV